MSKYEVQLQETIEYVLTVEAADDEQALEVALEQWRDEPNPMDTYGYEVIGAIEAIRADPHLPTFPPAAEFLAEHVSASAMRADVR